MKIKFSEIYSEVNTSYSLHYALLRLLAEKLNNINFCIDFFSRKFSGGDFTLNVIISAMRKNSVLEVKGPRILRKDKWVQFVSYIPYVEMIGFNDQVIYALKNIEEGLLYILEKYGMSSSGVDLSPSLVPLAR